MPENPRMTLLVAGLLIGSGVLTRSVYAWVAKSADSGSQDFIWSELVVGLPFAVVTGILWIRPAAWIPVAAFLDCVTWLGAYRVALFLAGQLNPYIGMAVGGLVGALGVTAATGLGCRSLYRARCIFGAALAGAVAGVPFGLAVNRSGYENTILFVSFPLWQVVVGVWLYRSRQSKADLVC